MLEAIFNLTNLGILLSLLLVNIILLQFSRRKRKYGLMPLRLLLVLFIVFSLGRTWVFVYEEKHEKPRLPNEVLIQSTYKSEKYKTEQKRKFYLHSTTKSSSLMLLYVKHVLRATSIQSFLGILFSFIGLISVYHRNEFYYKMMVLHSIAFAICCITEWSSI